MEKEILFQSIVKILNENFDIPTDSITLDAHLFHDLDIDSIDAVDLLINLKQLTGHQIAPEIFKKVQTVGNVIDAVYEHIKTPDV